MCVAAALLGLSQARKATNSTNLQRLPVQTESEPTPERSGEISYLPNQFSSPKALVQVLYPAAMLDRRGTMPNVECI
eukprot:2838020-Amphidinium_carterae.1